MTTAERREQIISLLMDKGKIKTGEFARIFEVSTETIRKDLLYLEKQQLIRKNKGSAELLLEAEASSYARKSQKNVEVKKTLAEYAAKFVPENATILLDAGSTNYQLALRLIMRKDITVVTNFPPIAELFNANQVNTILLGGFLMKVSGATTGSMTTQCIDQINADIAFVGTSGSCNATGPCVENMPEAEVKQHMIKSARKTYIISDSSKFQASALFKYAEWKDIDVVFTDDKIEPAELKKLEKQTKVYVCEM